mmetsp:Transcript_44562/g.93243  ORF Transcript_44562/g.93243 Transcript_44562/m.93243 type:complete len:239 (+) Transcript_44562:1776-2492(+)
MEPAPHLRQSQGSDQQHRGGGADVQHWQGRGGAAVPGFVRCEPRHARLPLRHADLPLEPPVDDVQWQRRPVRPCGGPRAPKRDGAATGARGPDLHLFGVQPDWIHDPVGDLRWVRPPLHLDPRLAHLDDELHVPRPAAVHRGGGAVHGDAPRAGQGLAAVSTFVRHHGDDGLLLRRLQPVPARELRHAHPFAHLPDVRLRRRCAPAQLLPLVHRVCPQGARHRKRQEEGATHRLAGGR